MSRSWLLMILMLETLLPSMSEERLLTAQRNPNYDVIPEVSSCVELKSALAVGDSNTTIQLNHNLTCSESDWGDPVTVAGHRVLEGLVSREELLITHLDLTAVQHGIMLTGQSSLCFNSLVIHIDHASSTTLASILPSVLLEGEHSTVFISKSVIVSHTCDQPPGEGMDLSLHSNRSMESRVLNGSFQRLHFCRSQLQCFIRADKPSAFTLDKSPGNESGCPGNELRLQGDPDSSQSKERNRRRRIISLSFVCFFVLFFLILGLAFWRRLSRCEDKNKTHSTVGKEESRTNGASVSLKGTPYIIKLGDTSIDTSQELGTGGFGTVYEGTHKNQIAAVKIIQKENSELEESADDKESRISECLLHENVVRTFGCLDVKGRELFGEYLAHGDRTCKVIAMEYCDKGELGRAIDKGEYVLSFRSLQPNLSAILHSALDIAKGLEYLHSIGIVHGDLKPDNILRKTDEADPRGYICKICDFGLSRKVGDILAETDTLGMISYMPPELLQEGHVGRFTDIYSFGMLLWEMATSDVPFAEVDYNQIVLETVNGRRPQIPDSTPSTILNLITSCWDSDYTTRPSASQVIRQLKLAVSEWYSSFPICSVTIPTKNKKTRSDVCEAPRSFLTSTFGRLDELKEEGDWCTTQTSCKKRRPFVKAQSYYEIHKQVLIASAPSLLAAKKATQILAPLENERITVSPLLSDTYPSFSIPVDKADPSSSRTPEIKDDVDSEDCTSRTSLQVTDQETESPLTIAPTEAQRLKRESPSQDQASVVSNSTPRSMLAGLSGSLRHTRFSSHASSNIDRNFTTYQCELYTTRNIGSEASLCNTEMEGFEDV